MTWFGYYAYLIFVEKHEILMRGVKIVGVLFVYFQISKYCQIDLCNNSYSDERVQVLLMSGMSNGAFADICSLRSAEERIAHWNNVLKFAVFKKDHALITIGGPWSAAIDGGDPLIDSSCLVRTAIRYVII